ncbi:unnamed protein product [Soboliphyme baturini]|uniref:Uncharacterized protein n=1 Tax=Soboliphyme baturini TaxID=241478 RepID=A0A183IDI8_9BILA|nr:unnamed protein product [Soboliphyme baturini]
MMIEGKHLLVSYKRIAKLDDSKAVLTPFKTSIDRSSSRGDFRPCSDTCGTRHALGFVLNSTRRFVQKRASWRHRISAMILQNLLRIALTDVRRGTRFDRKGNQVPCTELSAESGRMEEERALQVDMVTLTEFRQRGLLAVEA